MHSTAERQVCCKIKRFFWGIKRRLPGHHKAPQCFRAAAPLINTDKGKNLRLFSELVPQFEGFLKSQRRPETITGQTHLQDFNFLAKKDLGLGQVLLINALDGHLPVGLLWTAVRSI